MGVLFLCYWVGNGVLTPVKYYGSKFGNEVTLRGQIPVTM